MHVHGERVLKILKVYYEIFYKFLCILIKMYLNNDYWKIYLNAYLKYISKAFLTRRMLRDRHYGRLPDQPWPFSSKQHFNNYFDIDTFKKMLTSSTWNYCVQILCPYICL